jgi:serine/threonine protein kinase
LHNGLVASDTEVKLPYNIFVSPYDNHIFFPNMASDPRRGSLKTKYDVIEVDLNSPSINPTVKLSAYLETIVKNDNAKEQHEQEQAISEINKREKKFNDLAQNCPYIVTLQRYQEEVIIQLNEIDGSITEYPMESGHQGKRVLRHRIVAELFDDDLFCFIQFQINLTEYEVIKILYDIVQGMFYLHTHGIVHRDIKFENILVSGLDRPQTNNTNDHKKEVSHDEKRNGVKNSKKEEHREAPKDVGHKIKTESERKHKKEKTSKDKSESEIKLNPIREHIVHARAGLTDLGLACMLVNDNDKCIRLTGSISYWDKYMMAYYFSEDTPQGVYFYGVLKEHLAQLPKVDIYAFGILVYILYYKNEPPWMQYQDELKLCIPILEEIHVYRFSGNNTLQLFNRLLQEPIDPTDPKNNQEPLKIFQKNIKEWVKRVPELIHGISEECSVDEQNNFSTLLNKVFADHNFQAFELEILIKEQIKYSKKMYMEEQDKWNSMAEPPKDHFMKNLIWRCLHKDLGVRYTSAELKNIFEDRMKLKRIVAPDDKRRAWGNKP